MQVWSTTAEDSRGIVDRKAYGHMGLLSLTEQRINFY
jgi:hypothetical protein